MQRQRIAVAREPDVEPPEWWRRLFGHRQHTLRCLITTHLACAGDAPGRGLTSSQIRSCLPRFETAEINHAIGDMAVRGLIVEDVRVHRPGRGEPRPEVYWRLPEEGGADVRDR